MQKFKIINKVFCIVVMWSEKNLTGIANYLSENSIFKYQSTLISESHPRLFCFQLNDQKFVFCRILRTKLFRKINEKV
jgi:hypothetical protein